MNLDPRGLLESERLPRPAPALARFYRVSEEGSETAGYVGLDRNERLEPFPGWFMEKIRQSVDSDMLTDYPSHYRLQGQLADSLGVSTEQILLTPGSDAAVKSVFQAYVQPGDGVVMLDPSYAMFPIYTDMFQAKAVPTGFDENLRIDTERLLESISPGVKLALIANPNQPTGTLLETNVLHELIERAANVDALVAIDEAYYPFSNFTVLPLLDRYPHLLMLRTFSKAGLAGLRIGYVVGHPEVIGNLFKVRSANDINSFAILCASEILTHVEVVEDYVAQVEAGRQLLTERTMALGLTPLPTNTNFMLVRVGHCCHPVKVMESLLSHGYMVKGPFSTPGLKDCIRVTLGPPQLMDTFASVLETALSEVAKDGA